MTVQEIRSRIGELQKQLAELTDPVERSDVLDEIVFLNQLLREEEQKKDRAKARAKKHLTLYYHCRPKSEKDIGSAGSVPAVAGTPTTQADR